MGKITITNKTAYILLIAIAIIYILIKTTGLNYSISDENTSFYIAKLMSEGKTVYKDFFYAHPPLQIYLLAVIYKVFGFSFLLLKLTPVIFTLISALFIFKIMQNYSNSSALIAVLLFLFSYDSLRASTYAMGINLTVMFLIISVYFLFKNKFLLSGVFSGLAGITGLYSLIAVVIIFILLFRQKPKKVFDAQNSTKSGILLFKKNSLKKNFVYFLVGFSIIFVLINLLFVVLYGNNYIIPVYKFHFLKPKGDSNIIPLLVRIIKTNLLLFLLPFVYFFTKKRINLIIYISIALFLFLVLFQKTFGFYFMLLFPFLAIISAYSITKARLKINKNIIIIIFIFLIIISSIIGSVKFIKYDFQNFNNAQKISDFIATNSKEKETIFGDDSTVPLIALLSKRKIALDFADSNSLRFRSGIDNINEVIKDLKESKNRFIIIYQVNFGRLSGTYGPAYLDEFFEYTKKECKLSKTFKEKWNNYEKIFSVYDCKK